MHHGPSGHTFFVNSTTSGKHFLAVNCVLRGNSRGNPSERVLHHVPLTFSCELNLMYVAWCQLPLILTAATLLHSLKITADLPPFTSSVKKVMYLVSSSSLKSLFTISLAGALSVYILILGENTSRRSFNSILKSEVSSFNPLHLTLFSTMALQSNLITLWWRWAFFVWTSLVSLDLSGPRLSDIPLPFSTAF